MSVSGLGRRAGSITAAGALAAGVMVAAAGAATAATGGERAAAQACTRGAELEGLSVGAPTVKAGGWSVVDRRTARKGAGKIRARVKVQGSVKARVTYRATGTVNKCDGAGPKKVALKETVSAERIKSAAAVAVRSSTREAVGAAKGAAKDKVRARGAKAARKAVKAAAREDAKNRLLAKAGVAPASSAAPDASTLASRILTLVNAERAKTSLAPLKYLPQFVPSATTWADVLVDGPFDHDPNLKAAGDALGCNKRPGGFANAFLEAIAKGDFTLTGSSTPSVDAFAQQVVQAWMASATHRPILLSSATSYVGIGSVYRNKVWTVVYRSAAADCSNITGY